MKINYHGNLTPGIFVINEDKKDEWGLGQVQSSINDIITINFENVGKKTINSNKVKLKKVKVDGIN